MLARMRRDPAAKTVRMRLFSARKMDLSGVGGNAFPKKPAAAADGGGDVRDVGGFIRAFGRSRFLARDAFSFELVLSEALAV